MSVVFSTDFSETDFSNWDVADLAIPAPIGTLGCAGGKSLTCAPGGFGAFGSLSLNRSRATTAAFRFQLSIFASSNFNSDLPYVLSFVDSVAGHDASWLFAGGLAIRYDGTVRLFFNGTTGAPGTPPAGSDNIDSASGVFPVDGTNHAIQVLLTISAGTVDYEVIVDNVSVLSGTYAPSGFCGDHWGYFSSGPTGPSPCADFVDQHGFTDVAIASLRRPTTGVATAMTRYTEFVWDDNQSSISYSPCSIAAIGGSTCIPSGSVRMTQLVALAVVSRSPDPAIADDPTGGGTVGASTDPAAGVDLCGADVPVAFADITPPGGSTVRYSKQPINVTVADDPRVQSFGSVTRALTNRSGDFRGSQASAVFIDTDRFLRDLEDSDSLVNAVIEYFISTESAIKAGSTPRRVFSGLVTDSEPMPGLAMRLQASDYLQSLLDVQPPKTYPQRVFTVDDFPPLANDPSSVTDPGNPTLVGKPIPIGYGKLSDEELGADAVGVCPAFYTGKRLLPVYGSYWDEYVFFGHAPGAFQSLFVPIGPTLSTGTSYGARTKITPADTAVEYLMPGNATWTSIFGSSAPYRDFNGNRYTVCYGFGPRSELNRTGQVPLVANLWGIEDVGDGTGDVITSLPRQMCHLLINWVLNNYASGAWLSPPTVNSYSRLKTAGFEAAKTRSEVRTALGYLGAFILAADGSTVTLTDLARMFYEHGLYLGTNKDGQIIGSAIDPTAASVRSVSDVTDTIAQSFRARRQRSDIRNRVLYRYARRYVPLLQEPTPAEGDALPTSLQIPAPDWNTDNQELTDSGSITKYGTRTMDLSLALTRDQATADDISALHLEVLPAGPMVATYREGLCGTGVELGDNVALTHFEGVASAGYVDRDLRCEVHTVDLDKFETEVQGLDLQNLPAS